MDTSSRKKLLSILSSRGLTEVAKDLINLPLCPLERPTIVDDEIYQRNFLLVRNLRGETRACILFECFALFLAHLLAHTEAVKKSLDFQVGPRD